MATARTTASAARVVNGARVLVAAPADKAPLVSERGLGRGRVVTIHFDIARLLADRDGSEPALGLMSAILDGACNPEVKAEGQLVVFSALKKGKWVVVTFLPPGSTFTTKLGKEVPARGRLRIDMRALGVNAKRYKVINLARDREMMPQGKDWDFFGRKYWTAEALLQRGVDVYMAPNSLEDLDLPSKCEDPYVTKYILPRWPSRTRAYEHDIIAIAPAAEPFPTVEAKR